MKQILSKLSKQNTFCMYMHILTNALLLLSPQMTSPKRSQEEWSNGSIFQAALSAVKKSYFYKPSCFCRFNFVVKQGALLA